MTGYNVEVPDDDEDDFDGEYTGESESEEESVDEAPQLVNGKKRKLNDSLNGPSKKQDTKPSPLDKLLAEKKEKSKAGDKKEEVKKAAEMQKKIAAAMAKREEESDEDEDDDEDGEEEESEDDELLDGEAEEAEDDGEEEEEEESDDEDMETDEAKPEVNGSPKKEMNGSPKKEVKSDEKTPETPESGDKKKKKKKNKKKNKNKENVNGTGEAGDDATKTPAKADQKVKQEQKTPAKADQKTPGKDQAKKTPKRTLKGGIQVEDLKEGNGPEAKRGKMVGMYYEGKLKANGKTFDSTLSGKPFKFRLGAGEVIKGWDVGLDGIKVGGKRRLTIPAPLAYGKAGAAPEIPPNATLVFDVECKAVN